MSGYITKSKAHREKCYSLQAGEAPPAFPRRHEGAFAVPIGASAEHTGALADDPAVGGCAPISRVDSAAAPWRWGRHGFPPIRGGPLPLALFLV
jgi:hypothetical protein